MVPGILGRKIGMTQIFDDNGKRVPVTVMEAGPCVVLEVKTSEKHGYDAVQLGFDDMKEKNVKKPQRGALKAKGLTPKKFVREIRCEEKPEVNPGDKMTSSLFQKGDFLDVTGISKGKGFQGGMKRCGWKGGKETHGSMSHRVPGSIGASSFPSRVHKGHPFPGHMGHERITVQNLKVVSVDEVEDTIVVNGPVPGPNGSYLLIRFAHKKPIAEREVKEPEPEEAQEEEVQAEQPPEEKAEEVEEKAAQPEETKEESGKPEAVKEEAVAEAQAPEEGADKAAKKKQEKTGEESESGEENKE